MLEIVIDAGRPVLTLAVVVRLVTRLAESLGQVDRIPDGVTALLVLEVKERPAA